MILEDTPIEMHEINGRTLYVKREDLCTPSPGPPFSKVRGLWPHMVSLQNKGIQVVGYVESSVSMAGWGIAWIAKELGMKCVIYNPVYKKSHPLLKLHRKKWKEFSADIRNIKAGMVRVNYNICRKKFKEEFPTDSRMLDLGIPLKETIEETAFIWKNTMKALPCRPTHTIINVGSGTILSGIIRGWRIGDGDLIGVLGRMDNIERKWSRIIKKSGVGIGGLLGPTVRLFCSGYEYAERSRIKCPFPCHPYYDLKAWEWLVYNIEKLDGVILFWNIGRQL